MASLRAKASLVGQALPLQFCPAQMPMKSITELGQKGRGTPRPAGHTARGLTHQTLPRSYGDAGRSTACVQCRISHTGPSHNAADPARRSRRCSPSSQRTRAVRRGQRRESTGWTSQLHTDPIPAWRRHSQTPHASLGRAGNTEGPERRCCCHPEEVTAFGS